MESGLRVYLEQTALRLRFERMVREEPYGREAEALLRRLSVFRGPFRRHAINAVAPETMDEATREAAFYTLRRWAFILQTSHTRHKRLYLPDHIEQVVPPDVYAANKHFFFYWHGSGERKTSVFYLNLHSLRRETDNIWRALLWGLDHHPEDTLQRVDHLERFINDLPPEKRLFLIEAIERVAQQEHDDLNVIFARLLRARLATHQQRYAEAQHIYQEAMLFYQQVEKDRNSILYASTSRFRVLRHQRGFYMRVDEALGEIALAQRDPVTALSHFQTVLPEQTGWQVGLVIQNMHKLALVFAQAGHYAEARDRFIRALAAIDAWPWNWRWRIKILWAWGLMEYGCGHQNEGRALCCMALNFMQRAIEDRHRTRSYTRKMKTLSRQLETMDCEDC